MSRTCYSCGKKAGTGNKISHSNRKSKRKWHANLQKINILVDNKKMKEYICTKCIKAGKIVKAV